MAKRKPLDEPQAAPVNGHTDPPLELLRPAAGPPTEKSQPIHQIRLRNVRAAIWQNSRPDGQPWYAVTYSRTYRDEQGNWHTTDSYSGTDLLLLAEVSRLAFLWVIQTTQSETPF
jgi:hypothetical protein